MYLPATPRDFDRDDLVGDCWTGGATTPAPLECSLAALVENHGSFCDLITNAGSWGAHAFTLRNGWTLVALEGAIELIPPQCQE